MDDELHDLVAEFRDVEAPLLRLLDRLVPVAPGGIFLLLFALRLLQDGLEPRLDRFELAP